jgi:taurine dioxygenase
MQNRTIDVTPLAGCIGAELSGVDLAGDLSAEQTAEIRGALLEHRVIFFRDQRLTPQRQVAFGRRFGEVYAIPFVKGLPGQPEVIEIVKEATAVRTHNFGGRWHTDMSFEERPAMASVLYALETPPHGGDTIFANTEAAYEGLSDGMRRLLDGMTAMHSAKRSYGSSGRFSQVKVQGMAIDAGEEGDGEVEHPVVRTHPETGRRGLYVNPVYTIRFKDMSEAESAPLLDFLNDHCHRPEYTCRFRWRPGSVAFWDNRCTQHLALNDYDGFRRRMQRVTLRGDRPF